MTLVAKNQWNIAHLMRIWSMEIATEDQKGFLSLLRINRGGLYGWILLTSLKANCELEIKIAQEHHWMLGAW